MRLIMHTQYMVKKQFLKTHSKGETDQTPLTCSSQAESLKTPLRIQQLYIEQARDHWPKGTITGTPMVYLMVDPKTEWKQQNWREAENFPELKGDGHPQKYAGYWAGRKGNMM